jgi:hypothetical protein
MLKLAPRKYCYIVYAKANVSIVTLNTGRTSVSNKVFLVLDFIVHFSHYMFRPRLAAIFWWFVNTKNISKAVTLYSTDPLSRYV